MVCWDQIYFLMFDCLFSAIMIIVRNYLKLHYTVMRRLDRNIKLKSSNNTYLNIIEIFKKLFKKINIIESQNLLVTSTSKKGNFKSVGKFTSVT